MYMCVCESMWTPRDHHACMNLLVISDLILWSVSQGIHIHSVSDVGQDVGTCTKRSCSSQRCSMGLRSEVRAWCRPLEFLNNKPSGLKWLCVLQR